jgi:hypothetical protein
MAITQEHKRGISDEPVFKMIDDIEKHQDGMHNAPKLELFIGSIRRTRREYGSPVVDSGFFLKLSSDHVLTSDYKLYFRHSTARNSWPVYHRDVNQKVQKTTHMRVINGNGNRNPDNVWWSEFGFIENIDPNILNIKDNQGKNQFTMIKEGFFSNSLLKLLDNGNMFRLAGNQRSRKRINDVYTKKAEGLDHQLFDVVLVKGNTIVAQSNRYLVTGRVYTRDGVYTTNYKQITCREV